MLQRHLLIFTLLALLLSGCGSSAPDLPGFDAARWRADARACRNERAALLPALDQHRQRLYGVRVGAITDLLGRPDVEEIAEQGQRLYYYYVEPSYHCQPQHPVSNARRLLVRIGALGTVIEVMYTSVPSS